MPYVNKLRFRPDLDPTEPGILADIDGLIPTFRGYRAAPSAQTFGAQTATATVVGAASVRKLDGTTRTFYATPTDVQELSGSAWSSVSRSGGYSTTIRGRFTQYGNETVYVNGVDTAQASISGAFADITGAPAPSIMEVIERQAIAFNVDGDADRWRTSAQDNLHDWVTSIGTLAGTGLIVDTPGAITAGRRLGAQIGVYKGSSIYIGTFDTNAIWNFDLISDEVGAPSHEAVVPVEHIGHFFMGPKDFYVWNGAQPQSIGAECVRDWFFETQLLSGSKSKVIGIPDASNSLVYWFYPSQDGDGVIDKWIAFNYNKKEWGKGTLTVQYAFSFTSSTAPTYNTLGDFYATYNDLPLIPYDSALWNQTNDYVAIFNTTPLLQTLSGVGVNTKIITGDFGGERFSYVTRVRPRFYAYPTTGALVNAWREKEGSAWTSASLTVSLSRGKFDIERESRWHSFRMNYTGNAELMGFTIDGEPAGDE